MVELYKKWFLSNEDLALKSKSFNQFLFGSFIVRTSDWMDLTLLNWLVYQWTDSPMALGVLNVCRLSPILFFSLYAGLLADRYDRKKVLMVCYGGVFLTTLLLGFLVQLELQVVWLYLVVFGRSIFMTIEVPVRNSYLTGIVEDNKLASAISLQTMVLNLARMIGPALAGWLLLKVSAPNLIYLLGFGAIITMLIVQRIPSNPVNNKTPDKTNKKGDLKEAFSYIKNHPLIVSILLIAIAPMIFGFPYTTMLPLFVEDLMDMGPNRFGLLLSISSVGAIVATLLLTIRKPKRKGKVLIYSPLGFGLCLGFFILFHHMYLLSLLLMFMVGLTSQMYRTTSRIAIQIEVPDELRGRVLSIALMDRAYIPLGALLIGFIAGQLGVMTAGLFMGFGCLLITLLIVWRRPNLWNT